MNKIVHIILDHPELKDEFLTTVLQVTAAQDNVIFATDLKEGCDKAFEYDYALVSYVGTMYKLPYYPASNITTLVEKWAAEESHIHPCKQGIDSLSPMFLNLKYYREHGAPPYANSISFNSIELNFMRITSIASSYDHVLKFKQSKSENIIFRVPRVLYKTLKEAIKSYNGPRPDVIYSVASGGVGEYLWDALGTPKTSLVLLDPDKHVRLWQNTLYGYFGQKATTVLELERATNMISRRYGMLVDRADYRPRTELEEDQSIWSDERWVESINKTKEVEVKDTDILIDTLEIPTGSNTLIYVEDLFTYTNSYWKTRTIKNTCDQYDRLLELPNTTVVGINPHTKEMTVHENYSS